MDKEIVSIMNDITTSLKTSYEDILAAANKERGELYDLIRRMNSTHDRMHTLAIGYQNLSATLSELAKTTFDTVYKIAEVMEDPNDCPNCNYEDFVGYCDCCGGPVLKDSNYNYDHGSYTCEACCEAMAAEEEKDTDPTTFDPSVFATSDIESLEEEN